jgi:hypothetical protein
VDSGISGDRWTHDHVSRSVSREFEIIGSRVDPTLDLFLCSGTTGTNDQVRKNGESEIGGLAPGDWSSGGRGGSRRGWALGTCGRSKESADRIDPAFRRKTPTKSLDSGFALSLQNSLPNHVILCESRPLPSPCRLAVAGYRVKQLRGHFWNPNRRLCKLRLVIIQPETRNRPSGCRWFQEHGFCVSREPRH